MSNVRETIGVFRPSRWYRNSFMLLGSLLAVAILPDINLIDYAIPIVLAFISLSLMTSGNYGLNEILDIETDRQHPQKKHRALVTGRVKISTVLVISVILYTLSTLLVLSLNNWPLTIAMLLMLLSGITYNVKPFRTKDIPYLDFLFEALNNPIRLAVGWYAVEGAMEHPFTLISSAVGGGSAVVSSEFYIPLGFLVSFYFIGIFLMSSKRFGEIRLFKSSKAEQHPGEYRKSLKFYSEQHLLYVMMASIISFSYLFGALSYKYNIDLIILLPIFIVWIIWYFILAFEENSIVKDPERIFEKKGFLFFSVLFISTFAALLIIGKKVFVFL
jgi:4-hydroxybenzoate polyprenyltransferase